MYSFSKALEQLKEGSNLARKGWNGSGIFIQVQNTTPLSKMSAPYLCIDTTGLITTNTNAPRCLVPWLPSQTDILADDWVKVD